MVDFQNFWSLHDDYLLMQVIYEQAPALLDLNLAKPKVKWSVIAMKFNHKCKSNKLGKHCKERWFNHLSPNLNKTVWTDEEDILLLENALIHERKWAKITQYLPGRTQHNVKNRFLSLIAREHKISCKKLSFKENCCKSMILTTLCRLKKRFNFSKAKPLINPNELASSISENFLYLKKDSDLIQMSQELPITMQINQELPGSIIQMSNMSVEAENIQQLSELNQEAIKIQQIAQMNPERMNAQQIAQLHQEVINIQQLTQMKQEAIIIEHMSFIKSETLEQVQQLNQENNNMSGFNPLAFSQIENNLVNSPNNINSGFEQPQSFEQKYEEEANRNVNFNNENISFNETLGDMYYNLEFKNDEEIPNQLDQMKEIDIFEDNNEFFEIKFE